MKYFYFILVFAFSNSYIIKNIESYALTYYMADIESSPDNCVVYTYTPKSKNRNIYLSFLGDSGSYGNFEFFLYSKVSDIKYSENEYTYINYLEAYYNTGETKINSKYQSLDIFYIVIKMYYAVEKNRYWSFMIYNLEEYFNIGYYNEYVMPLKNDKDIVFYYPSQSIQKYYRQEIKANCKQALFYIYENNINSTAVHKKNYTGNGIGYDSYLFKSGIDYYIKLSIKSSSFNRILLSFSGNDKNITKISGDFSYSFIRFDYSKYLFLNIEKIELNDVIAFNIKESSTFVDYTYSYKLYSHYDINELPNSEEIKDYDYEKPELSRLKNDIIAIEKIKDAKGLLIKINTKYQSWTRLEYYEMKIHLYKTKLNFIKSNTNIDYYSLINTNLVYLSKNLGKNIIMKSNLNYFNIISPNNEKVISQNYLFDINENQTYFVIEFEKNRTAFIELKLLDFSYFLSLKSPDFLFLCNSNEDEKYIYLPYMTSFNVLYGDLFIYDIDVNKLSSLDYFEDENYMEEYNYEQRYDYNSKRIEEKIFYKIKCTSNSLLKYENAREPWKYQSIDI